jgi:hypothetical protein
MALHGTLHGLGAGGGRRGHSVELAVRVVVLRRLEFGELPGNAQAAALDIYGPWRMRVAKVGCVTSQP